LLNRFLRPTLQQWRDADPRANPPLRWLGILDHDGDLLREALAMRPEDTPVRKILIDFALGHVEYATHHLGESCFLGSVEEAIDSLRLAGKLIADAPDPAAFAWLAAEMDDYQRLIADWQDWSAHKTGAFPDWCREQGRDYGFPAIFYYEK
jgi:hypothetical protein